MVDQDLEPLSHKASPYYDASDRIFTPRHFNRCMAAIDKLHSGVDSGAIVSVNRCEVL